VIAVFLPDLPACVQVSRQGASNGISVVGNAKFGHVHTALLNAVDPATIDCVIITNFHNMLALPYVTESAAGFRGVVLATEPTAEFGKLAMLELSEYIAATSFGYASSAADELSSAGPAHNMGPAQQPYTSQLVQSSVEKIVRLNYMQSSGGFLGGFCFSPWPSGYCIGLPRALRARTIAHLCLQPPPTAQSRLHPHANVHTPHQIYHVTRARGNPT
jgi:Cft2 family RNA processing exonuclease